MKAEVLLCLYFVQVPCLILFVHKSKCHKIVPLSALYSLHKVEESFRVQPHLLRFC